MKYRYFLALFLCFALSYAQDRYLYELQGPGESWLSIPVNPITGTFSVLNLRETSTDFSSLLFSGPAMSSHIGYMVDGNAYHQSNLQIRIPVGPTAGYQIDGVFESPEGIHIETAYFLMSANLTDELKTLGVAVLISNTTDAPHTVGVKILLDSDIGESQNNPLIHLPNGSFIDRPFRFPATNLPSYLYIGEKGLKSPTLKDRGFFIYPYISTNFPSMVVIENWRRLSTSPWFPRALGNTFAYDNTRSLPDAGVGVYFGEYLLEPNQEITMGVAVSLEKIVTVPVLKDDDQTRTILTDDALSRGIFAPERYIINEMLANPSNPLLQEILNQRKFAPLVPGRGLVNGGGSADKTIEEDNVPLDPRAKKPMDVQILKKNLEMERLNQLYNESLGFESSPPRGSSQPPSQGIIMSSNMR
ncbi:MAG: hypothetical protein ACRCY4_01855 [Brevinema sp.]